MRGTVALLDTPEFHLEAPDVKVLGYKKSLKDLGNGDIPKGAKFVEIAVKNFALKYGLKTGIKITTKSEFSSLFGFGSSSASTVCVIKALSEITGKKLSQKAIFELAYKTVLDIQGKGSGFDVAAAVYGGTLYYVLGGKVLQPLNIDSLPLIVGYSGVKADTVTLMNAVKEKSNKYPQIVDGIYTEIETLVELGKKGLKKADWESVGELMNINQGYLAALGVSTKKLSDMIYSARDAGAYGAKLSGAGGGDCIIVLAPDEKRKAVEKAIEAAGGEVLKVKTNAEGVRIEG
jgi:mevalonate kinase